jgi:hypothetical protein
MFQQYVVRSTHLFLCAALATASAQESPSDSDISEDEIEVVVEGRFQNSLANRLPIDPDELPFSLDVIDKDLFRDRGFINQFDALQTIPNLFQNTGAEGLPVPSYTVRGFAASVLTNNRPESFSRGVGQRDQSLY